MSNSQAERHPGADLAALLLASAFTLAAIYLAPLTGWARIEMEAEGASDIAMRLALAALAFLAVATTHFRIWLDAIVLTVAVMLIAAIPASWRAARDAPPPPASVSVSIDRATISSNCRLGSGSKAVALIITTEQGAQDAKTIKSMRIQDLTLPAGFDPTQATNVTITLERGSKDSTLTTLYTALAQDAAIYLLPPASTKAQPPPPSGAKQQNPSSTQPTTGARTPPRVQKPRVC
jgi:hypothetical protein